MHRIDRQAQRHHFTNDWLSAYWHFSYEQYYDPERLSFGPLRVFNDDTIRPRSGFPMHGSREMEIVTVVLSGTLEHEDNQGNRGVLEAGEVQVMSAGTGIVHAERNPSTTVPLHVLQDLESVPTSPPAARGGRREPSATTARRDRGSPSRRASSGPEPCRSARPRPSTGSGPARRGA